MAKNKTTVNALEKYVATLADSHTSKTIDFSDDFKVRVECIIPIEKVGVIVTSVVNSCFAENGEYIPYLRELITKKMILENYTNMTLPSNLSTLYYWLSASDVYELVVQNIDPWQMVEIKDAISEGIEYKKAASLSVSRVFDKFNGVNQDELMSLLEEINKFNASGETE